MKKIGFAMLALFVVFLSGCGISNTFNAYAPDADVQDSPEKVVKAFYEALTVSSDSALQFVSADAQKSERFKRTWEEIKTWKFIKAEVVGYSDPYVEVDFEIMIDGEEDSGTDEVEVQQIDGKWWIVSIPS